MINLLGFLMHFLLNLVLIVFHWIVCLAGLSALFLIFKQPLQSLGTAFICTILFCITPSCFAAQPATNPSLSQPVVYNYQNYQEETTSEVFQEAKSSGSGKCDYPEQLDSRGYRCGNRAASIRAGGRLGGTL